MHTTTFRDALREALVEEMRRDDRVIVIGEDVGPPEDGVFKVTRGLAGEFGAERVRNTPISEAAIAGCAVGAAIAGLRPVVEIMYSGFMYLAMDQLCNHGAMLRYMSGGQVEVPLVVRVAYGIQHQSGAQHATVGISRLLNNPGLKIAIPSTPYDAKGLLKAAIRDNNPVVVFEHIDLYRSSGDIPEEDYVVPLGQAQVRRPGQDVTVIATGVLVGRALEAASTLAKDGVEVEVIDPRTLVPFDRATILASARKTGRAIIAEEGPKTGGEGAEIAAILAEEAFAELRAPIVRLASPDVPAPFSPILERSVMTSPAQIVEAVTRLLAWPDRARVDTPSGQNSSS